MSLVALPVEVVDPAPIQPYTSDDSDFKPLITFDCRGLEFVKWIPRDGFTATSSASSTHFDVDLSDSDGWYDYDEKGKVEVSAKELAWKWMKSPPAKLHPFKESATLSRTIFPSVWFWIVAFVASIVYYLFITSKGSDHEPSPNDASSLRGPPFPKMAPPLKAVVVPATAKHTATVFVLHGLGDSGHGWTPVAKLLSKSLPHVKFVLPHAPTRPVTINSGHSMPAWFDVLSRDWENREEDEEGIMESVAAVEALMRKEVEAGIPESRVVLGGFSQGGAITLVTIFTTDIKLGGAFSMSGFLPLKGRIPAPGHPTHLTPTALFHGTADPVVPLHHGRSAISRLTAAKVPATMKEYRGMGHTVDHEVLTDVESWLRDVVPERG
ncbi:hypothetical protein HDU93_004507 [Gonapodya sp. JEL0774]|nr:hypothetical protein HDU93_004507 [Gonapodya sp. JEL0774]